MTFDVQEEYKRMIHLLENASFTVEERDAIAEKLDEELGLAGAAARLWMGLPIDNAFASQPAMFMIKPPGTNLSVKQGEHVQWTWRDHHFMLFAAPLKEPGTSMLGVLIDDQAPVMEVYVKHNPDDNTILTSRQIFAITPGEWIDDFLSYFGAYCRLRARSEAARDKYQTEMQEFWRAAGI